MILTTFERIPLLDRQEALTAAIGEKDAHIALLELNRKGLKSSEELKLLKKEKDALVQQLKDEVGDGNNTKRRRKQKLPMLYLCLQLILFFVSIDFYDVI